MPESNPAEPARTFDPCDTDTDTAAQTSDGDGARDRAVDVGLDGVRGPAGWLSQVVDVLLGEKTPLAAGDAGASAAYRRQLEECLDQWPDGDAPLIALHAWLAASVGPALIEAVARDGRDTGFQRAVQVLHRRSAQGESIGAEAWRAALEPALSEVYRRAYEGDQAFATASAAAASFALSRGYSEPEAAEYGRTYAEMNTEANLSAYADANAIAGSGLLSQSFAAADAAAYAATYPGAYLRACLRACATDAEACGTVRAALADGLTRALANATVATNATAATATAAAAV